jgi:hypothetical protein
MALVRAGGAWIVYGFAMFAIRGWVARGKTAFGMFCLTRFRFRLARWHETLTGAVVKPNSQLCVPRRCAVMQKACGTPCEARTSDHVVKSHALCRLS